MLAVKPGVNLDTLWQVLSSTVFSPLVTSLVNGFASTSGPNRLVHAFAWLNYSVLAVYLFFLLDVYLRSKTAAQFPYPRCKFSKEILLITGAGAGLGLELQRLLEARGATVVSMDVIPSDRSHHYQCDVSNHEEVTRTAHLIREQVGVPTTVISNAGIVRPGTILQTPIVDIQRTFDINLTAHFILARAFLPDMLDKGGQWVTIGSTLGYVGCHSLAAYTASKAAVMSFHESLTAELGGRNAKVLTTLVLPGQMSSAMFGRLATPNSFLAPVADVSRVAASIVQLIEHRRAGEFAMPLYGRLLGVMRCLPSGLQQVMRWFSGMDNAAKAFASDPASKES